MSVLCLGFPYTEAYLVGSGGCRGFPHLGCTPTEIRWGCCLGDGVFGTLEFFWFLCHVGVDFLLGLHGGLVSVDLFLYLFVDIMASWAFCWWGYSIVLYGVFWVSMVS